MRKIFILIAIILIAGCSSNGIGTVINEVYGTTVSPKNESDGITYTLDYLGNRTKLEDNAIKLKDKIDKTTGSVGKKAGELPNKDGHSFGSFYHWDTPNIRILMTVNRSITDAGNNIVIIVNNK